jgi:hypothetical protein
MPWAIYNIKVKTMPWAGEAQPNNIKKVKESY